jgi:hypothetical protein
MSFFESLNPRGTGKYQLGRKLYWYLWTRGRRLWSISELRSPHQVGARVSGNQPLEFIESGLIIVMNCVMALQV